MCPRRIAGGLAHCGSVPKSKAAAFQEGLNRCPIFSPGWSLRGVVTNVAAFGTDVDIGVHQEGLARIRVGSIRKGSGGQAPDISSR